MATIRTAIQIQDNMSQAFQSMNTAMNVVLNSFEALQTASSQAVDTRSIQLAREELAKAETAFNDIEEEIKQASNAQKQFNDDIRNGTSAADGLLKGIAGAVAAYLSISTAGNILSMADEITNTTARLDLMNDGLQSTADLQNKILASANRTYSSFDDTADMIAKLGILAGDAFGSNNEVINFAEQLNKHFVISGTETQGIKAVMLQLTQAMAGGVLRGQELNSVFENAPTLIQNIADYLKVTKGEIREMAADGLITADIVKKALFAAADETNARFEAMPNTFKDVWTVATNNAAKVFEDFFNRLTDISDSQKFLSALNGIMEGLEGLASAAVFVLDILISAASFTYDNWSLIGPIIGGVSIILLGYATALGAVKLAEMAAFTWRALNTTATLIYAAAIGMGTGATWSMVAATWGLNAALAANPIFIVIMAVAILIGLFYAAVAVINYFAGTSYSATGIIAGAFMVLGTHIYNQVAYWWNIFASIAEFFVNVWKHPMYSVKKLFNNLAINFIDNALAMSSGWDNFATSFVNAIISAVNGAIKAWNWFIDLLPDDVAQMIGLGKGTEFEHRTSITSDLTHLKKGFEAMIGDAPEDYWEAPKMELKSLSTSWDTGYKWGSELADPRLGASKEFPFDDIMSGIKDALGPLKEDGKKTAGNTAKMAKSMEGSEEDLKYLRDLAEREVINRFTTAGIKVDFKSENTINSDLDLDGIIDQFAEKLEEAIDVAAEGA